MTWDIVHRGRKIQVAIDRAAAPDGQTIQRDVVLHPGRYAYPKAARAARILNLAGVLLLAVGVLAVLYGILLSMQAR